MRVSHLFLPIFLLGIILLYSCSKEKTILKSDDLRESFDNLSGSWYFEGDWAFERLWISFPNDEGDQIFYYFAKNPETQSLQKSYYVGIINKNSFISGQDPFGEECIRFNPTEDIEGSSVFCKAFYIIDKSNYLPGYQLRNNINETMVGKGLEKDNFTEGGLDVNFFEYERAKSWAKDYRN